MQKPKSVRQLEVTPDSSHKLGLQGLSLQTKAAIDTERSSVVSSLAVRMSTPSEVTPESKPHLPASLLPLARDTRM